jgi:glycolate oxidase iron-sulfur subunit
MACVTACPSGVQYEDLLEATRPQIERQQRRSLGDRLFRRWVFAVFPHPARLRLAAMLLWMYQRVGVRSLVRRSGLRQLLPRRLAALDALAPDVRLAALWARLPERLPPVGPGRLKVGMLTGCVQSVFFADVNAATARVLTAEGCEVTVPTEQGCCGALEAHTGQQAAASQRAKAIITAFDDTGVDLVVTNAAGCGSNLKRYGRLLADDPAWAQRAAAFAARVRDVTELLVALEPRAARQPLPGRVAYHDACHLAHAQGLRREPRALLQSIPDLQLLDLPEPDMCCGSAGVYNLLEPEPAADLGRRKAELIRAAAPQAVASANPGCLLQLRRHLGDGLPLLHPVQLVDCSIRGVPPPWPDGISGKSVGGPG